MFAVITGFNMTCSVGEVVSADISMDRPWSAVEVERVNDRLLW